MDQPTLIDEKTFVRDLEDGQAVESIFVVRDRDRRQKRNGEPFLKLRLGDTTGEVETLVWDRVEEIEPRCAPGTVVRVAGRFAVDKRYGASLTARSIDVAGAEEYDPADLLDGPPAAFEQMEGDLRSLLATIQSRPLAALLERFFGEASELWARWREAPAAKRYHQAYRHGLLEHSLSVAQAVSAVSATFPGLDREVAIAGALLHDIGKIEAYASKNDAIELTDAGKLQGEIPLGYYMVRREIEQVPDLDAETAQAVLHIILSHHGTLEHGSPVVPCTREATLVHMMDNLGGRLGSFDRIEKGLSGGACWSGYDPALSGSAYFGPQEREQSSGAEQGQGREQAGVPGELAAAELADEPTASRLSA